MTSNNVSEMATASGAKELYQYQPLDPKKNEIRLLKIHLDPGGIRYSEPVKCSLITTSLDEAPNYRALSYTWGTEPEVEDISVDGRRIKVTPHLEHALLQLRDNAVDLIWIDAICINQYNLEEQSEQVRKMRTIYGRADEVVVWLGSSIGGGASLAFDLFEELFQFRDSREDVELILNDERRIRNLEEITRLFQRPYWNRRWVIQRSIQQRELLSFVGNAQSIGINCLVFHIAATEPQLKLFGQTISVRGTKFLELPQDSSDPPSLHTLLCQFWEHRTSNPRDKIYALVGLSSARDDPEFVIDYSAPTRRVFSDAAKYIIRQSQSLDVICLMIVRESIFSLPSWVPDWTLDKRRIATPLVSILEAKRSNFCAAGDSAPKFDFKHSEEVLSVSGIILNRTQFLGEKENLYSSVDLQACIPLLLTWYRLCRAKQIPVSLLVDGFSRAIFFDTYRNTINDITLERTLAAIMVLAEDLYPGEETDTLLVSLKTKYEIPTRRARSYLAVVFEIIRCRRLFISDSNRIGMGPDKIEPGDIICILLGCSVPVILRPKDGHYILLGETYFQGYMYRKAMDELAEAKVQLESFEIH